MCWVIEIVKGNYHVGYYTPDGEFVTYYLTYDRLDGEQMCHYLNGGNI